jgi:uncharacterized membrane protein (DUF441 family)
MNSIVISLIRTLVPIAVGGAVSWLAAKGLDLDPSVSTSAIIALTGLITGGYYTLVRLAEQKFPSLGILLGHPAKPSY